MTILIWTLTLLGAVVIVLTRMRLQANAESGRFAVSDALINAHTVAGGLALVLWSVFLIAAPESFLGGPLVGILAIGAWWVTAGCGLVILSRWLPSGGRHAPSAEGDTWGQGPGLSVLAHVGMALGVVIFTWAYLTAAV
jgi:hypothetical protein